MNKKLLLLDLLLSIAASASAVEVEINGLWYEVVSKIKEAKVIRFKNNNPYSGNIVIPGTVEYEGVTCNVTSIGEYAFYGCNGLTSITFLSSELTIEEGAFYNCRGLTSVTIANSVKSIGGSSFAGCNSLTSVHISDLEAWCKISFGSEKSNPLSFAHHLFLNEEEIKDLVIPDNVLSICDFAFYGCNELTSVVIGDNVSSIGNKVFGKCSRLTSVKIGNNVTSIGNWAFEECSGLTTLTIVNSVTNIGEYAFYGCNGLATLTIGNSVSSIGEGAFYGCSGLTSIMIPNSVSSIGGKAFDSCNSLTSVHISDLEAWCNISFEGSGSNPLSYAHRLFLNEEEIKDLIIPNSVSSIGNNVFCGCSGLTSVVIPNSVTSIGYSAFEECTGLTSIIIPNSVTSIENSVFYGCSGLNSVVIGAGVRTIGWLAFSKCTELSKVQCLAENVPETFDNVFDGSYIDFATLYVPTSAIESYKTSKPWSNFNSIKSIEETQTFKLTYIVDGEVYKTYDIEEGTSITPEISPTKEGYTFSGWNNLPETMPANDVTVEGTFTINKYKLVYLVDGEEYKSYDIEYNSSITAESEPSKEGYTFSGWSEIPETMPANDVTVTGSFTVNKYKLTYILDGVEYKTYEVEYGATISPETNPEKEGYTFSGWIDIPETMPAHDVTIYGTFTQVEFTVDNVTYEINDDGTVTIKDYDQTGEVTIASTVIINGQTYQVTVIAEDAFKGKRDLTSVTIPEGITTIGNNAFAGCIGLFKINIGKDVQTIGSRAFANVGTAAVRTRSEESTFVVNCYTESVPQTSSDAFENTPLDTAKLLVNDNLVNAYKSTYPWSEFGKIYAFNDPAGINSITIDSENAWIYDMQGNRLDDVRKGVNIIRTREGKTKKIVVK